MSHSTIHCETAAKINFACHQSAFAYLRELRIENNDPKKRLDNVLVTLSSNPAFLKPKSWKLDRISPEGIISITDRDIELDGEFLLKLADSMTGVVTVTVEHCGEIIAEQKKPVELLAYNEWGGAGYMPELLAAFSMPNDPAVDRVLHDASLILRKAGRPDGIDGYGSGSRQRIWEITSAIYTAICNLGITYTYPPASFERDGQKIRLPSQILENRTATCLDTTLLFASALEQAGLYPIVALPHGHAVAGVWLQPEDLSTIVVDEAEILRKRSQLKELLIFETTYVTNHPAPPFSRAVQEASDILTPDRDNTFNSAVDIRRARAHRIKPLGKKSIQPKGAAESDDAVRVEMTFEGAPVLPDFDEGLDEEEVPETPAGRLERWQRKLLDLSARNPLLNHRSTKTSLRIICPEPGRLEDKLADGARISIQPLPQPTSQAQDEELHRQRTGEVITKEYAREILEKKQVLVDLPPEELSRRAVSIYRKARTSLQEGGANTLYLALGFLLWKRDEKDSRKFRAPLILLPVTLVRKSVRSGIRMLAHDDETRFNTTLLEMLRKDFQIDIHKLEVALPKDLSGVDVTGVWNIVRRAVKDVPGFEVVRDVVLGHFSFAKYLMWKDLVDRTEALRSNAVVKHLIDTPRDPYPSEIRFVEGADVDRCYKPSDLLAPLPADSSQMAAIATADRGKDFVIIGPPGTGKSQTISNLISHMLGKGKKVLFVSEKTAALEVVHRRLEQVGLGQFALQLHSNKARKLDVLKQLRMAWEYSQSSIAESWSMQAGQLKRLRDQLNLVVNRLHLPRRNGMTAFEAMGIRIRDENLANRVTLSWPSADFHDKAGLAEMREAVEKLRIQASAVGNISDSPFKLITKGDWSPQWERQVSQKARKFSAALSAVDRKCDGLLKTIGIKLPDRTVESMDDLADLATILQESWRQQTAYALEPDGADRIEALGRAAVLLKSYAKAKGELSCPYDSMSWRKIDGKEIARRWHEANNSWLIKRILACRRVIKDMKESGATGTPDPKRDAPVLSKLRKHGEAIDQLDEILSGFKNWKGHETGPDSLVELQSLGQRVRDSVQRLADDTPSLLEIRRKVKDLLLDGNDLLAPEAAAGRVIHDFHKANRRLHEACDEFEALTGQSVQEHFVNNNRALSAIRETVDTIASRHRELSAWCGWWRRRTEAMDLQLAPLVEAIEQDQIPTDEIEPTFNAAYCDWFSAAVIGEDKVLRNFSTPEHVATIRKFRRIDDKFQRITSAYIGAKLAGCLPKTDSVTRKSSWGVLRHEIQKKRMHKPVRRLMEEIPDVITTLAPCLMMSPLSIAQYLAANQALFDVVIFDEASQITVWDAVGCLARARQAIVVGDPKQMPPTNFFARSDDDPDGDIDMEGDLESILDEMLGASIPDHTLNLHYRSRRESLIAFSNNRYYDDRLVTFPAPIYPDKGIRLIRPNGYYARGKARRNKGEAKAIVGEILRRLTHQDPEVRKQSIGVVTFNSEQQNLIEDLLDRARYSNPRIESAFAPNGNREPVFVKNLETVQGDERDVIMFSVTYAPDQADHMTMNFGPLNRDGGERRLNVAITRARSEMLVFSSLSPDRIDLSRTQARAVRDLKHFLHYAERGKLALAAVDHGPMGDFESPFEIAVARALRDKGWEIHPQVGVSAYRIDLGIVHPDAPGAYLAGVECDGAMYHSSAFARERDKIRQSVLEGLGWTMFRIWSRDWWTHKARALEDLHNWLTIELETDRQNREEAAQASQDKDSLPVPLGFDNDKKEAESLTTFTPQQDEERSSYPSPQSDLVSVDEESVPSVKSASIQPTKNGAEPQQPSVESGNSSGFDKELQKPQLIGKNGLQPYEEFDGPSFPDPRRAQASLVAEGLCKIIQVEGPMLAKRAYDLYLRSCGIRRMGKSLKSLMNKALQHAIRQDQALITDEWEVGGLVRSIVRSPDSQPVVARERGPRGFDQIPPSELQLVASLVRIGREDELEHGSEEHLRAVLKAFDLRRFTKGIRITLLEVLERRYPYVDAAFEEMAPEFEPLLDRTVGKETGDNRKLSKHEQNQLRLELWTELNNYLERKSDIRPYSPSTTSWHNHRYRPDIGHFVTRASFFKDPEVCVELYMQSLSAEEIYRKLLEHKDEIERSFGEPLNWDEVEGRKARKIFIQRTWNIHNKDNLA